MVKLDTYDVVVEDTPAHKIIRLDNLSTNDTVDLTSEFIKNDYIAYYDGVKYSIINFFTNESSAYPGRDRLDIAAFALPK